MLLELLVQLAQQEQQAYRALKVKLVQRVTQDQWVLLGRQDQWDLMAEVEQLVTRDKRVLLGH